MGTEKGNIDLLPDACRRKNLREKFLHADVAMTGANFAVASTGEIVVCTNEGNADMGTSFPKVHIATMGMEKIVPNLEALGVFTRLLARSGTGATHHVLVLLITAVRPRDKSSISLSWITGAVISWRNRIISVR